MKLVQHSRQRAPHGVMNKEISMITRASKMLLYSTVDTRPLLYESKYGKHLWIYCLTLLSEQKWNFIMQTDDYI